MVPAPHFWLRHVLLHPHVFAAACLSAGLLTSGPLHDGLIVAAAFFVGVAFGASLIARFAAEVCIEANERSKATQARLDAILGDSDRESR